ncbi:unnamed protein product [Schistosoma haematobium]|nr:unnamed protein product [Schistosoma haematobium]
MYERSLRGSLSQSSYTEPVINLRSPDKLHDRTHSKKHNRYHKSRSASNHDSSLSVVSDKRARDSKLELVEDFEDDETNKFHLKSTHTCENPTVSKTSAQNNPLLSHDRETFGYEPFNISNSTPNLGHLYSHVPRHRTNQTLITEPEEYDQYVSDDSQIQQLFPDTVQSMPCSPRVNELLEGQCVIDPSFTNSEHFGHIYQPNTNLNIHEFYECQLNKQLTKLSMLHAQQLNIQVLLEREWLKLHKLNCLKMAKYGYNDIKKSENYDQSQYSFIENINNARHVHSTSSTNTIPVHSPEMRNMNSFKHQNDLLYLSKNFKSAECGLNNLDGGDNQVFNIDTYNDNVLARMQERSRNSADEGTFNLNSNYRMISPNYTIKDRKPVHNLNSTILYNRDHLYSQELLNRLIQSSQSNGYTNYTPVFNKPSHKLSTKNNYHFSELNNQQIIKKPSVPKSGSPSKGSYLTSSEIEIHLPREYQSFQSNQHSKNSFQPGINNQNLTKTFSENQNLKQTKLNKCSGSDRLSSKKYLKSDCKKKLLLNRDDSKLPINRSKSPPQMFILRKSASQPCIYKDDINKEEINRSSPPQKYPLIKQSSELNANKSSTESIDREILDIDYKASTSLWYDHNDNNNNVKKNTFNGVVNHGNDQHCLQDTSQLLPSYPRIIKQVSKLPKHIEVDKEKDYEYSSNSTSQSSTSNITNNHIKTKHKSMTNYQYNDNKLKVIHATDNTNSVKKPIYEQNETSYNNVHISRECKQNNIIDRNDSSTLSNSLSTLKLSNGTANQQNRIISSNCTTAMIKTNNNSNNNGDLNKFIKHTSDDQLNNYELDLTNDSGISSVNKDSIIPSGVICLHKEINHMVFGPSRNSLNNAVLNFTISERINTPTWLALCTDEMKVYVHDLWTHSCLTEFMNHAISSTSPVIHLFSLNPLEYSDNSKAHVGFLCVVQKNGILTLYNIATRNMISRTILECEVYCASVIPCQGKLDQYLPQSIFSIDTYGSLTISQWKIITNNKDTVLNEPTLCDETLEIGTNIFKEISRKGKHGDFKYCTYIHDNFRSQPNGELKLNKTNLNIDNSQIYSFNDINPCEFSFITAAYECTRRKILRLTNWICKSKGLRNTVSYNKILSNDPNSNLIDMTVVESGCSGSLCMCFTNEIFWLSLHTFDILSKFKLPTFMQPINCLSKSWPQPADLNQSQHRRTWISVNRNRLLEISPFESQRRLDTKGRSCLLVCPVLSTDSQITTVSSGLGITPIIATALENGEIHITHIPESCFSCMVEFCSLGFINKNELVNHVVQDHYLGESTDEFRCNWASCDLYLPLNCSQFNKEILEDHAHQHVYS